MSNKLSSSIQSQVEEAIKVLRRGGLVTFPTDTVYGLGAATNQPQAVEKIFHVKRRPRDKALPLLLGDVIQLSEVASGVSETAWRLARAFLPGALTLVLPRSGSVPDIISGGGPTIAVRVPDHPVPLALIRRLGAPIVGTSANLSSRPSPLTADEVRAQLGDRVDLIIDDGRCPGGIESTILDVTGEIPRLLCQGAIPREELEKISPII